MTKVEVIIRPEKLEDLQHALEGLGHTGMTVTDVRGAGRQAGYVEHYRGAEYRVRLLPKIKVEVVVTEAALDPLVAAVREACMTGEVGDGKIFLWKLDNAVRIRTGESGDAAL
jgi:nitrogen regulatory protein P-II 1